MWRKKRTISTSKSTSTLLMKPSLSFANKNRTTSKSKSDNGSSDLDRSKHRCPSITNLLSIGGVVDVDPAPSTRTINIDKDEEDEENFCSTDRWTPNNNGKDIGIALDVIYDRTNNAFIDSDDDEDEEFEGSHIGNQIPTTMHNDDTNNIDKVKGQLPISKLIPLTRPTTESFPSSQTTSGKVTTCTEAQKKETTTTTTTDIMMKLPNSFTYFHTTEDKEKVGSSQHFPTNLHLLLDEAAEKGTHYSHIVSWCSQGTAFQLHDLDAFVHSPLLTKHFGPTNDESFDSFLRQLQAYDFHRCDKSGVVSHPLFIRGRRSLCFRMSQQQPTTATGYSSSLSPTAAAIDSTNANDEDEDEDEDEEVYLVGYNDEGGSPYDYEGNNNNIGLDIDNDSIGSEDDEEEQIDSIEGHQSQEETLLLIVRDDNKNSKAITVHNNSCQLTYRSKGTTTSAPDLTSLISSSPITSVSSSSQTTTKKDNAKGMITAYDKEEYLVAVSDRSGKHIKRNTMSSTSLVSSIMKKENSTNSLTSLRSNSSSVRFGSVEIHEHSIELGCSVHSLRQGPSVTLGWERTSYEKVESIEDHKKQKETPSSSPSQDNDNDNDNYKSTSSSPILRPRSVEERIDKLLENGYTLREIRASLREDNKERTRLKKLAAKQRFRKRTLSLPDFSTFFSSTRK